MSGWRPIETRPPDEYVPCWVADAQSRTMVVAYKKERVWHLMWRDTPFFWSPTHWMPLPELPEQAVKTGV